jgi:hypothetical protein
MPPTTDADPLDALAQQFTDTGMAMMTDAKERRLFIINIAVRLGKPAVLLAYEGYGSAVYEFDRPLNAFRLISAGFPAEAAGQVAALLAKLFPATRPALPAITAKALHVPKVTHE